MQRLERSWRQRGGPFVAYRLQARLSACHCIVPITRHHRWPAMASGNGGQGTLLPGHAPRSDIEGWSTVPISPGAPTPHAFAVHAPGAGVCSEASGQVYSRIFLCPPKLPTSAKDMLEVRGLIPGLWLQCCRRRWRRSAPHLVQRCPAVPALPWLTPCPCGQPSGWAHQQVPQRPLLPPAAPPATSLPVLTTAVPPPCCRPPQMRRTSAAQLAAAACWWRVAS